MYVKKGWGNSWKSRRYTDVFVCLTRDSRSGVYLQSWVVIKRSNTESHPLLCLLHDSSQLFELISTETWMRCKSIGKLRLCVCGMPFAIAAAPPPNVLVVTPRKCSVIHIIVATFSSSYHDSCSYHFSTLANVSPFTLPPPMANLTLRLKPSLFPFKSSAASLLSGSDAFGSRNRNCRNSSQSLHPSSHTS